MTINTNPQVSSPLTLSQAEEIIGGLSNPSKMPWYGWSISAFDCGVGSKLRQIKGSVCASCYAMKGRYTFANVRKAHDRRKDALKHPLFVEAFVTVLTKKYENQRKTRADGSPENRFRWHDSGDVQDEAHLLKIIRIAELCPFIEFYVPTKEKAILKRVLAKGTTIPANLHIKVSSPLVGSKVDPQIDGVSYSTVGRDDDEEIFQCPAKKHQGNECLDCDACWTSKAVNYPIH